MEKKTVGFIEVVGLATAIEAAAGILSGHISMNDAVDEIYLKCL